MVTVNISGMDTHFGNTEWMRAISSHSCPLKFKGKGINNSAYLTRCHIFTSCQFLCPFMGLILSLLCPLTKTDINSVRRRKKNNTFIHTWEVTLWCGPVRFYILLYFITIFIRQLKIINKSCSFVLQLFSVPDPAVKSPSINVVT